MECNVRLYGGIRKQSDSKEISLLVMRMGNVAVNAICECANVNVNSTRDFMGRHGKSGDIIILMGNFRGILHNKCDPIIIEGNLSI